MMIRVALCVVAAGFLAGIGAAVAVKVTASCEKKISAWLKRRRLNRAWREVMRHARLQPINRQVH